MKGRTTAATLASLATPLIALQLIVVAPHNDRYANCQKRLPNGNILLYECSPIEAATRAGKQRRDAKKNPASTRAPSISR